MDYDDKNQSVQIKSSKNEYINDINENIKNIYKKYTSTILELTISCKNLLQVDVDSNSDPFVVVFLLHNKKFIEVGRTEILIDEAKYFIFYLIVQNLLLLLKFLLYFLKFKH